MDISSILYVKTRIGWREWLEKHYQEDKEIWLKFPKKHTGLPRISYDESVEEALCFGWIDSIEKRIDDDWFVLRFTPRNPKTAYSESNKKRLRKLIPQGKVVEKVLKSIAGVV